MNKRTKIIVSVAGIFIVLLALLGLTYAYFLTKINGNSNVKSISVTTADLALDYGEETSELITKSNIKPGETILTKKFTATNTGTNEVEYAVILENVVNNFTRKEDVVYILECTSSDSVSCNGVGEGIFPSSNKSIIVGNKIASGTTHNYTLTITYKEAGVDQSVDMGATLSAKVNIADPNAVNPYVANKNLLAYNIINNAATNKNGTELRATPLTIPAQESSDKYNKVGTLASSQNIFSVSTTYQGYYWTYGTGYEIDTYTGKFTLTGVSTCKYNEGNCPSKLKGNYVVGVSESSNSSNTNTQKPTTKLWQIYKVDEAPAASSASVTMKVKKVSSVRESVESTMSFAQDDWGTSYYYRGDVEDNYLELNNMCFRIVRIQGDGSIKITLAKEGKCSSITASDTKSALINNAGEVVYGYDTDSSTYWTFNYEGYTRSDGLYTKLNNWYSTNLSSVQSKLKNETWCLGGKTSRYNPNTGALLDSSATNNYYNYETGMRLFGPYNSGYNHESRSATYRCSDEADSVTNYIGALTADEVVYAGEIPYDNNVSNNGNKSYYLNDNANGSTYWLLSRSYFDIGNDRAFCVNSDGYVSYNLVFDTNAVRPAVSISSGAEIASGDGTISNPYTIK